MIFTVIVFGAMNLVVKSTSLSGVHTGAWRLAGGSVVSQCALLLRGRRLTWPVLRRSFPGAVAFSGSMLLFFEALNRTAVANVAIIGALQAALVLTFVGPIFGERVSTAEIVLTVVATGGVVSVILAGGSSGTGSRVGDLLAVCGLVVVSGYLVFSKRARTHLDALDYQTAVLTVGALLVVPFAAITTGELPVPGGVDIGYIAILAIVGSTAHLALTWAHAHVEMKVTGALQLGVPVSSTALAWVLLDERLTGVQSAGMAVTVVALASLATR